MNFDEILKKSIAAVNDGYAAAHEDLTVTVDKVREAVVASAGGQVALELKKSASDIKGTTYRLYLDPNVNDMEQEVVTITYFQIPASGYPIKYGIFRKSGYSFTSAGEIEDQAALLKYFGGLLEQPESVLVQAIGFALRQRKG